jgi:Fic family protein
LAGVGQTLPNPGLLIGSFKRREAVLSSRIEGTQASMDDLLLFEAAPTVQPRVPDVREVWNYVRALEHGLAPHRTRLVFSTTGRTAERATRR